MIKFEVNSSQFVKWTERVKANVREMTSTLFEAGKLVDKDTEKYVPIDWGYLIRSYEGNIFDMYPKIELEMSYTGRHSPRFKGYDYAFIQHNYLGYNHKHGSAFYLAKGVLDSESNVLKLFEKDYLSCFGVRL